MTDQEKYEREVEHRQRARATELIAKKQLTRKQVRAILRRLGGIDP